MALTAGVGHSMQQASHEAGFEAVSIALSKAGITAPDLVLVFASVKHEQEKVVQGARSAAHGAPLIGCSTAGEITGDGPKTGSVVALVLKSDSIVFTTAVQPILEDAKGAGRELAKTLSANAPSSLKTLCMFPDILSGNGADMVRGALETLGAHFPIIGGAAGDDFAFEKTFAYHNDDVVIGSLAGLGLSGDGVHMGLGVRHGWMPIGLPMTITKATGSVIYEIDNKPAIRLYEDYFEDKAEDLRSEPLARTAITYPLGLKVEGLDEYLIRDPLKVGDDGSITCAAEVPEGAEVRLMIGSRDHAIEAAREAARKVVADMESGKVVPKVLIVFNCIAREKLFGQHAVEEIRAIQDIIGDTVPLIGFYTYGEIAPLAGELHDTQKIASSFFNETAVLVALGE